MAAAASKRGISGVMKSENISGISQWPKTENRHRRNRRNKRKAYNGENQRKRGETLAKIMAISKIGGSHNSRRK